MLYVQEVRYIKFIYDKSKNKLEVAVDIVIDVTNALVEYQVIIACDSWYTKASFISSIKNINIIGVLRIDIAMFNINVKKTHKCGRPRKRGKRIDYHN